MAHFAKINSNNIIEEVVVIDNSVLDDGTEDAQGLPFFSKLASSSGGDPSSNDSKLVNFAIDASGAIANTTYSTEVTFELYVAE